MFIMDSLKLFNKLLLVKKKDERVEYPYNLSTKKNIIYTKKEVLLYRNEVCRRVDGGCIVYL